MTDLMNALVQFGPDLWKATTDTFLMVGATMLSAVILGTPLGILLFTTTAGGLHPRPMLHRVASYLVNVLRSFPFIILLVLLIPFSRFIVGTSIGPRAAAVALSFAVIPFSPGWSNRIYAMSLGAWSTWPKPVAHRPCRSFSRCCCQKPCPACWPA